MNNVIFLSQIPQSENWKIISKIEYMQIPHNISNPTS